MVFNKHRKFVLLILISLPHDYPVLVSWKLFDQMDFENDNVDPYQILGVPFGASIEVCKATYKSLTCPSSEVLDPEAA